LKEYTLLCDEELEVVVKSIGTTYSVCWRYNMNIIHISAGTGVWMYVD
jgi:hypothetical protein